MNIGKLAFKKIVDKVVLYKPFNKKKDVKFSAYDKTSRKNVRMHNPKCNITCKEEEVTTYQSAREWFVPF